MRSCCSYHSIERVWAFSITVWYTGCTTSDRKRLECLITSAEKTILTSITRAAKIMAIHRHPVHHLFNPLPSGRRCRSLGSRTNRLKNNFFLWAIRTLNSHLDHKQTRSQFTATNICYLYILIDINYICILMCTL